MPATTIVDISENILSDLKLETTEKIFYQLPPEELIRQSVEKGEGVLSDTGALVIDTGEFTGRSPKDRYIVKDKLTESTIDWNGFNQPIEEKYFDRLYDKVLNFLKDKKIMGTGLLCLRKSCVSLKHTRN